MSIPYIPTIRFRDDNLDTILSGLDMEQVKDIVFEKFIPTIKHSIQKKKKTCIFCYVNDEYQVIISRPDWGTVLDYISDYYIKREKYDICAEIRDLKELL